MIIKVTLRKNRTWLACPASVAVVRAKHMCLEKNFPGIFIEGQASTLL
jgi:hypothetical protein